jgi:3-deoxy-D-manno-octulosonate 8-phosphate phosphatase (KDO 8-P phosphatase)
MVSNLNHINIVAEQFEHIGGLFVTPAAVIAERLKKVKAFVFDWDGVFNDGIKGHESSSGFSEADAMALHILRYAYWKLTGSVPLISIVTAQKNESAVKFAQREHLSRVYYNFKDKYIPVELLSKEFGFTKENIASAFDDIIDYPLAMTTNVRFLINRKSSPLFKSYFIKNNLCDYLTGCESPQHPIREICELIVGLLGNYDDVLISRFKDKAIYQEYWKARNEKETELIPFN